MHRDEDGYVSLLFPSTLWLMSHTGVVRLALVDTVWAAAQVGRQGSEWSSWREKILHTVKTIEH